MKKLFYLSAIVIGLIAGCQNTAVHGDKTFKPINDQEMKYLKDYVLYNMLRDRRLTDDQRQMIQELEPVIKISYEADKAGKAYISWNIPQTLEYAAMLKENPESVVPYRTINIRGYGDLSAPNSIPWSVSLVNQSDVIVVKPPPQP